MKFHDKEMELFNNTYNQKSQFAINVDFIHHVEKDILLQKSLQYYEEDFIYYVCESTHMIKFCGQ